MPGVSIPHGWGHDTPGAMLGVASPQPGVNSNVLAFERHHAAAGRPDVVVMDVRMPRMDGLEATRRIVSGSDRPPCVLV